jgi:trimethylamine corrinoid protein
MAADLLEDLKRMVIEFNIDDAERIAMKAIGQGVDPIRAADALTEGIREVGERFGSGELFLPDLVCASEVVKNALPPIVAEIKKQGKTRSSLGTVVIGTVFGDIHSIGKSMVATLLFASGFEVIDLGVNVRSQEFLRAVKENSPDVLAMSALLTTTVMEQKNVIEQLKKENLRERVRVIVGGSPINREFAETIGADGYGSTAPEGVTAIKELLGIS